MRQYIVLLYQRPLAGPERGLHTQSHGLPEPQLAIVDDNVGMTIFVKPNIGYPFHDFIHSR